MLLIKQTNVPLLGFLAAALLVLAPQPARAWVVEAPTGVRLTSIAVDTKGNVVVGGSRETAPNTTAAYVARYRLTGEQVWEATLDTPTAGRSEVRALVLDRKGAIFAAGTQAVDASTSHPVIARLEGSTGKRTWWTPLEQLDGRSVQEGGLESLTLNAAGNPVAAGYAVAEGNPLGLVAALDGATGAFRWHWAETGGTVRAVAVDHAGNVGATGPFLAVKLDGNSGTPLWRTGEAGPQGAAVGFPQMRSLLFTPDGDLVVGGGLRNVPEDTHARYAARLNGATGAVRWEQAGRPVYALQAVAGLALDRSGDVFAAGRQEDRAVVSRLDGGSGGAEWLNDCWAETAPWETDQFVSGLAADARCLYVSGTEGADRFRLSALRRTGQARWRQDLGPGGVKALALGSSGRVYAVGALRAEDGGERSVLAGLRATDGANLKAVRVRGTGR